MAGMIPAGISTIKDHQTRDAVSYAATAYYKYIEYDKRLKDIEKRYLSQEVREAGAVIVWVAGVVEKRQISYGWSF